MNLYKTLNKMMPYFAVGIFILLLVLSLLLYNENKITKEIAKNCEWGEEDYRCFCKKGYVVEAENLIKKELNGEFINTITTNNG